MDNMGFLRAIERSFAEFIRTGTSRSTAKLGPLHGSIARDMAERLGERYSIKSQGYEEGKEGTIPGRYMDKKVDITIIENEKPVCGIAVKFVMQNYAQNSNNYFENMMGETANIRAAKCPYFQIVALLAKLPYYNRKHKIIKWETLTANQLHKYHVLDTDNPEVTFHSPNKTLIYVLHHPDVGEVNDLNTYRHACDKIIKAHPLGGFITTEPVAPFGDTVILNDYETFAEKVYHTILSL